MADIRNFFGGGPKRKASATKATPSPATTDATTEAGVTPTPAANSDTAVPSTTAPPGAAVEAEKKPKARRVVPDSDSEEEFDDGDSTSPSKPPSSTSSTLNPEPCTNTNGAAGKGEATKEAPVAADAKEKGEEACVAIVDSKSAPKPTTKKGKEQPLSPPLEPPASAAAGKAAASTASEVGGGGGFFAPRGSKAPAPSSASSISSGDSAQKTPQSALSAPSSSSSSSSAPTAGKAPPSPPSVLQPKNKPVPCTGPVAYSVLCEAFSKIEETSSRLEITAILSDMFEQVVLHNPADLEAALFLASNKVAPPHANMVLGIGEALLTKCIVQTFGRTTKAVKECYDEMGDLGLVAEQSRAGQKQLGFALSKPKPLGLTQVLLVLRSIAEMEGNKSGDRKIAAIQKMLRDSKGPEARFVIRALQGKLRIGLAETTVLVALAHAFARLVPPTTPTASSSSSSSSSTQKTAQQKSGGAGDDDDEGDEGEDDGEEDDEPVGGEDEKGGELKTFNGEVPLAAEKRLFQHFKQMQKHAKKHAKKQQEAADSEPASSLAVGWTTTSPSKAKLMAAFVKATAPPLPPSSEVLDAAVVLVKQAFAECSDHGLLAKALLGPTPLYKLREQCHLVPGTPVSPMLAKPTKSVDEVLKRLSGQRLTVEFKYDGERMQLHRLADGSVKIFSRSQEDTTERWPELASSKLWGEQIFKQLDQGGGGQGQGQDGTFVLDAEVVAWDVKRKCLLPFQVLSTRKRKATEDEEQAVQVIVQGFDLLYLHGRSLLRQPLIVRRDLMRKTFTEVEGKFTLARSRDVDLRDEADKKRDSNAALASTSPASAKVTASLQTEGGAGADTACPSSSSSSSPDLDSGGGGDEGGDGDEGVGSAEEGEQMIAAFMTDAVEGSCEGLMVKVLYGGTATYEPSVRSLNWLKLKKDYMDGMEGVPDSLDLVPIGAYKGKGKRTGVWGAYLLACYDPDSDQFQSVCKIGTGFSDENLQKLSDQLSEDQLPVGAPRPKQYKLGDSLEPDVYFKALKVWEVRAADLSLSSTHKGGIGKAGIAAGRGIGLRFPRFLRERTDKPPSNATTAEQIRDMYFDQQGVAAGMAAAKDDNEDDVDDDYI